MGVSPAPKRCKITPGLNPCGRKVPRGPSPILSGCNVPDTRAFLIREKSMSPDVIISRAITGAGNVIINLTARVLGPNEARNQLGLRGTQ